MPFSTSKLPKDFLIFFISIIFILFLGRLWDESGGYAPGHGDSFFYEEWLTPLGFLFLILAYIGR